MIMSLKLYENYLLMIRDNLIRCGVGLPVKDDYTYEELFNLSEEIDQILWYYRVLAIANSRDRLKDFIFPMDRTYVSYMRNVFYKEYCESKKDRREVTISGLVPNTDVGYEYRDTDEDEEELFEKSFDEEEKDINDSDSENEVNSSTDNDLTEEDLDEIWGNWGNDEDDSESDSINEDHSENESKSSVNTDKSDIEQKDSDLKELQDSVIYVTMDMLEIDEKGFYVYSTEDDEDAEDEDPFGDDSNDTLWEDGDEESESVADMDDSDDNFPDRDSDEEDEDSGSDIPNEEDEDDIFSGLGDDEPDEDVNTFGNEDDEDGDEDVDFPDNDDTEDDEDDIPDNEDDDVDFQEDENRVDDEGKDGDEDDLFSAWGDENDSNEDEDENDFPSNDVDNEDDDFPDLSDEDEDIPDNGNSEDVDDEDDFPDLDSEDEEDSDDAEDFPDWNDKDNQDSDDDDIDFSDWDEDQDDEDEEKVKHSVNKNKGSIKGDKPTPSKKDVVGSKGNKSYEGIQDSFEHTRDEQFVESFDKVINDTLNFGRKSGKKIINKIWKGMTNQE